ncbi:MAG: hypothetical protein MOGMAGMI_00098 [Candidatus Omnitrophica bacterium]|nr:hypothetical protein [Candidatus Omnitrophota bacterium]
MCRKGNEALDRTVAGLGEVWSLFKVDPVETIDLRLDALDRPVSPVDRGPNSGILPSDLRWLEIGFDMKVEWGAPHPGFFEDMLPELLRTLAGEHAINIVAHDSQRQGPTLLPDVWRWLNGRRSAWYDDPRRLLVAQVDGQDLDRYRDELCGDQMITWGGWIDGDSIMQDAPGMAAKCFLSGDDQAVRTLAGAAKLVYKVAQDGNGLYIASHELSASSITQTLNGSERFVQKLASVRREWGIDRA